MNKLVGITIGAVAVYGIVRLLKMQNVGDQTNISLVNPRVHAVNLGGLSFRTEVAINNHSKDSVKITKPVVSVKSKGKLLSQYNAESLSPPNEFKTTYLRGFFVSRIEAFSRSET